VLDTGWNNGKQVLASEGMSGIFFLKSILGKAYSMIRVLGRDWRATPCPLTKWRTWYHPGTWRISQEGRKKKTSTDLLRVGFTEIRPVLRSASRGSYSPKAHPPWALSPVLCVNRTNHSVLFMGWGAGDMGNCPLLTFHLDSRLSMQAFSFLVGGGGWSKERVLKFLTCSSKSSQEHLTFIPYALTNVVLISSIQVGQTGGILHFKIKHSILRNLHNIILFEWWANQIGSLQKKKLKLGGMSSS
jgi:hypothetical protein